MKEENQLGMAHERTSLALERNFLAAERTFSAWIRTGLAGVGGGLVIIKMISYANPWHEILARLTGQILIVWGVMVFVFAFLSYRRTCRRLATHDLEYNPAVGRMGLITLVLIVATMIFFAISHF